MKLCFKIALFVVSLFSVAFIAQQSNVQQIIDRFQKYQDDYVQEKVYLHTDKPYYAAGEEIWFKTYVLNAKTMGASFKSNLLYVELLDTDNKLKKRIKIALSAGTGWGNFSLADTLRDGNYRIRAYTNWMRNFDAGFYYDHTFKVGNIRTSQLIVETSYDFNKTASGQEITAAINYKNINGVPYANKEVIYKAELEGREIGKGKAVTDNSGNVIVKFNNNKPELQKTGLLTTSLKISENTQVNKFIPITQTTDEISLQFFPEGGDMVTGLRSKIAFKALKGNGKGVDVKGHIQDETGTTVAILNSRYKGMGFFYLAPEEGKQYEAIIKLDDGSEKKIPLPKAKAEGMVINVFQNRKDSMTVRLFANPSFIKSNLGKTFSLVAQSSGNLVYSAQTTLTELGGFVVRFPLTDFPLGITHLTLFNDSNLPILERLVFIHKPNLLNLSLSTDKRSYRQREKTGITLKVTNPAGKPFIGSFSMAVLDEEKVPVKEEEENTILSELLLNADLRGNVETPNYYFNHQDDKKKEDLDALLLTQGWRRFNWQNVISAAPVPINYLAEQTLAIRGKVKNNKKIVPNASIIVFGTGTGAIMTTTANEQGEFVIDSLIFPDSAKFVVQARSERGKKFVEIEMDDNINLEVAPKPQQSDLTVNISSSMLSYLKTSKTQYEELLKYGMTSRAIMLDEVKVIEKRKQFENSTNLNGGGNADRVITGEELQNAPTLEFALQGKVPGMIIQNGEIYFMRNMGRPAQIVLDGMYVESDMLNSINPNDVESVEILRTPGYTAIYGSMGGGGVIIINTKRGSSGGFSNTYSPGIITYNPLGIFVAKEFYSPNYDVPQETDMADLRSTIYWNPRVITDSTGIAKVNFYNADGTGSYRVVVEGADLRGHIGRQILRYQVN